MSGGATAGLGGLGELAAVLGRLAAGSPSVPRNRILLSRVDSTNRMARTLAACYLDEYEAPPPLLLVAREQTAGRGRRGRSWASPPGGGLYVTRLVLAARQEALHALPLLVPVALAEAVSALLVGEGEAPPAGSPCGIKWPNDLVIAGEKVGGILIEAMPLPEAVAEMVGAGGEAASRPALAIVGFGINLRRSGAGEDGGSRGGADALPAGATTIAEHVLPGAAPPELADAAAALVASLESALTTLGARDGAERWVEAYRRLSVHRPGERLACRLGDNTVAGAFAGFSARGFLRLEQEDGETIEIATGDLIAEHAT